MQVMTSWKKWNVIILSSGPTSYTHLRFWIYSCLKIYVNSFLEQSLWQNSTPFFTSCLGCGLITHFVTHQPCYKLLLTCFCNWTVTSRMITVGRFVDFSRVPHNRTLNIAMKRSCQDVRNSKSISYVLHLQSPIHIATQRGALHQVRQPLSSTPSHDVVVHVLMESTRSTRQPALPIKRENLRHRRWYTSSDSFLHFQSKTGVNW